MMQRWPCCISEYQSYITSSTVSTTVKPFWPICVSLNPCRASISSTADLFSSLPQKDNITGMLKVLFVPE